MWASPGLKTLGERFLPQLTIYSACIDAELRRRLSDRVPGPGDAGDPPLRFQQPRFKIQAPACLALWAVAAAKPSMREPGCS